MTLLRAASLACVVLWPTSVQAQLPDLVQTAVGNPPPTVSLGGTVATSDTALNQGGLVAVPSTTRYYLSLNTTKDSSDVLLSGGRGIPELGVGNAHAGAGSVTLSFTPVPGAYYLVACADDLQVVSESNETNNCIASATQVVIQSGDALLESEWHLKSRSLEPAGANIRAAWTTAQGAGVVIGVVDDGLQHTHSDLQPNYDPALSFDFNQNDADPSPVASGSCAISDCHGTSVAGVAAARGGNTVGVAGAGRSASLAGLRLISAPTTDAQEASALGYRSDAIHILNNSWGPSDDGATLAKPGPMTQAAIEMAASSGRNGLGRVLVWSAGNGRQNNDNCNFDGYATNRSVIAVGALADSGQQASYSEPCAALFVTAPSNGGSRGITTTDLVGSDGYSFPSSNDYTSTFGGTSSAAPLVSGVIALMLQANPSLTLRDIQHLLARTSHRINPGDASWTAARYPHSENFGFGLVDAAAAVAQAATWRTVLPEQVILPATHEVNVGIPDNDAAGRIDSIFIDPAYGNFRVERVEVVFNAAHIWRGDLEVTLISPSGVVSHLATQRLFDSNDNFVGWRFGSVRHWGESAAGSWTLRVADRDALIAGVWQNWTLRIYGTQSSAPSTTAVPTDFDGDGRNDLALYQAGSWQIQNGQPKQWGFPSDVPVPGDYNGDRFADAAVFRPSEGNWYIEGQAPIQWGSPADLPVPADYNGDGRSDIAVFRPSNGTWYVRGLAQVQFGLPGDIPVPGDYTGDGRSDFAVYRPSEGQWYILGFGNFQFGLAADVPVPGDYNGDGLTDIAVWRPASGEWFVRSQFSVQWGLPGDLPIGMDVNADGRFELVVYRRESGTWFIKDPFTGGVVVTQQGAPGSVPAMMRPWLARTTVGDMEGDRRADLTVFRPASASGSLVRCPRVTCCSSNLAPRRYSRSG